MERCRRTTPLAIFTAVSSIFSMKTTIGFDDGQRGF